MNYFLVKGKVCIAPYQQEIAKVENEVRLVKAETEDQAKEKFYNYFAGLTVEYDSYYTVSDVEVLRTIE